MTILSITSDALDQFEEMVARQHNQVFAYTYSEKIGAVLEHYADDTSAIFFRTTDKRNGYRTADAMNQLLSEENLDNLI